MKTPILVFAFLLTCGITQAKDTATSILRIEGPVQVIRAGKQVDATKGYVLQSGDEIITKTGATADVGWAGLWGCRVLEDSRVAVSSLKLEDQQVAIDRGAMLFRFKKLPKKSSFELITPTATASVRGTVFFTRVSPDKTTSISVANGEVLVVSMQGDTFTLKPGESADFPTGKRAVRRALSEDEKIYLAGAETLRTGKGSKDDSKQGYFAR